MPIQTKPAVVIENASQKKKKKKSVENVNRHVRAVPLSAMEDATSLDYVCMDLVHQTLLEKTLETHAPSLRWRLQKVHAELTAVEWSTILKLLIASARIASSKI